MSVPHQDLKFSTTLTIWRTEKKCKRRIRSYSWGVRMRKGPVAQRRVLGLCIIQMPGSACFLLSNGLGLIGSWLSSVGKTCGFMACMMRGSKVGSCKFMQTHEWHIINDVAGWEVQQHSSIFHVWFGYESSSRSGLCICISHGQKKKFPSYHTCHRVCLCFERSVANEDDCIFNT